MIDLLIRTAGKLVVIAAVCVLGFVIYSDIAELRRVGRWRSEAEQDIAVVKEAVGRNDDVIKIPSREPPTPSEKLLRPWTTLPDTGTFARHDFGFPPAR